MNEQRWREGLSPEGEARIKRAARLIGQAFNLEVSQRGSVCTRHAGSQCA